MPTNGTCAPKLADAALTNGSNPAAIRPQAKIAKGEVTEDALAPEQKEKLKSRATVEAELAEVTKQLAGL